LKPAVKEIMVNGERDYIYLNPVGVLGPYGSDHQNFRLMFLYSWADPSMDYAFRLRLPLLSQPYVQYGRYHVGRVGKKYEPLKTCLSYAECCCPELGFVHH
jgi:hypothetical protein